jgi:hypothetical protein
LHPVARLSSRRAALFDDAEFEGNEVMFLLVFLYRAAQMGSLSVEPIEVRWIDRVLHRLEPIAVINLVLFDPALAVFPTQHVPSRQQRFGLGS